MNVLSRIYRGQYDYDFPKFYRRVLVVSGVLIFISIVAFFVRDLNLSIDFEGGTVWEVPSATMTTESATAVLATFDKADGAKVQRVTDASSQTILRIQAEVKDVNTSTKITDALAAKAKINRTKINTSFVGPSWGKAITKQALKALVVFLIMIFAYISITLEWQMAVGAIVALIHDIIITVGVYAVLGFEVTPATVVSFLTILGFSLYDTVVVYDRVRENAERYAKTGNYTYTTIMRRSLNQVLMRSINTTLVAIMPVIAMLIGSQVFGQATLQDFGIALFVGIISGVFSSLAIAAPVVVWLKEREPTFRRIRQRIIDRGGDPNDTRWVERARPTGRRAAVIQESGATATSTAVRAAQYDRPHPPRPRKKPRR